VTLQRDLQATRIYFHDVDFGFHTGSLNNLRHTEASYCEVQCTGRAVMISVVFNICSQQEATEKHSALKGLAWSLWCSVSAVNSKPL